MACPVLGVGAHGLISRRLVVAPVAPVERAIVVRRVVASFWSPRD